MLPPPHWQRKLRRCKRMEKANAAIKDMQTWPQKAGKPSRPTDGELDRLRQEIGRQIDIAGSKLSENALAIRSIRKHIESGNSFESHLQAINKKIQSLNERLVLEVSSRGNSSWLCKIAKPGLLMSLRALIRSRKPFPILSRSPMKIEIQRRKPWKD